MFSKLLKKSKPEFADEPILRIKSKINLLKKLDRNFEIFGSSSHKYILNDVLSIDEIELFEKTHNIKLPLEYRDFLLNIGNGGVGPYYGLYPLSKYRDHYNEHLWEDDDLEKDYLDCSFSRSEKWVPDRSIDEQEQDFEGIYGNISICHEGCGYLFTLIVNGNEYGNVWFDAMVSRQGIMPLINQSTFKRYSFFDWYESWLDNSLKEFGY